MQSNETEESSELFNRVVEASGLAPILARAAVSRACVRAGIDPASLTRESLSQVIPHLEQTLEIYLREGAWRRVRALKALTQRPSWRPARTT